MSVSAQLRGLVSTNGCAVWPLTPPLTGVDRSRQRKRRQEREALRDRMRRIVRRDRHRRVGADQPAHAADVDDDVVADVDAPVVRQRDQVGQRRAVGLVRRVELEQQLAGLVEILLQRVDFRREEVGPRPGDDDHRRIVGHRALLREHQLVDGVVLAAERGGDRRCSRRARPRSVSFSPWPCVKYTFFCWPVTTLMMPLVMSCSLSDGDALGAALVVEDDRAVLLNLVLPARPSASCRDRCTRSMTCFDVYWYSFSLS